MAKINDLHNPKDEVKTHAAILRETKGALEEDRAECVVLGCTGMAGQAMSVQKELGIPVLDPVLMGVKMAELRANIWKKYGISHSKIGGYEAPPIDELKPIWKRVYGKPI